MKLRRIITVILCFIMLLQVPIIAQATENPSTGEYYHLYHGKRAHQE